MNCINAFLAATAYAYLACAVYTILDRPALRGISKVNQLIFYLVAFCVFMLVSAVPCPPVAYYALGVLYSFASLGSFIGYPQRWMAYWIPDPMKGSAAGQIGMAAWDLAIAVTCFTLV